MSAKIGFIGAGKMATAMIEGLLAKGLYTKDEIVASCKSQSTKKRVSSELGIKVSTEPASVFSSADVIVIAVKPNQIEGILTTNIEANSTKKLLVSIAAGIKISTLERYVPDSRIIRVMPNVCCMKGVMAYTKPSMPRYSLRSSMVWSEMGCSL